MSLSLSIDQKKALDSLKDWIFSKNKKREFITLGGYAGTGKTTLISELRKAIHKQNGKFKVAFCSFTGIASMVLQQKLNEQKAVTKNDSVSTIHSLIYSAVTNSKGEIIGWDRKKIIPVNLIIVDEASMIDYRIWNDLLSYKIPIIAVGDHGQLPPINGSFNLMEKPDLVLEKIHRQAEGHPIIDLSKIIRETGTIPSKSNANIKILYRSNEDDREKIVDAVKNYNTNTLVLCGFNTTRVKLNKFIRESIEIHAVNPVAGDRVICLKNNHEKGIYNGMIGTINYIEDADEDFFYLKIDFDANENLYSGLGYKDQFGNKESLASGKKEYNTKVADFFDFGYALTVHKAQGSQANRVILFEEKSSHMDEQTWKRWLYTAVTRAEESVVIVRK
ncbi:MAG: ATP-dependent RecD-like DNA helicase [Candidatus Dojkabacteria bacterium]